MEIVVKSIRPEQNRFFGQRQLLVRSPFPEPPLKILSGERRKAPLWSDAQDAFPDLSQSRCLREEICQRRCTACNPRPTRDLAECQLVQRSRFVLVIVRQELGL